MLQAQFIFYLCEWTGRLTNHNASLHNVQMHECPITSSHFTMIALVQILTLVEWSWSFPSLLAWGLAFEPSWVLLLFFPTTIYLSLFWSLHSTLLSALLFCLVSTKFAIFSFPFILVVHTKVTSPLRIRGTCSFLASGANGNVHTHFFIDCCGDIFCSLD